MWKAGLLACGAASVAAQAQTAYPTRPIRIIVPTAPGSAGDTLARVLSQPLSERLGQPVIVDARPGGGTIIGTEAVAKAPPDGHVLLIALPALAALGLASKRTESNRGFSPLPLFLRRARRSLHRRQLVVTGS